MGGVCGDALEEQPLACVWERRGEPGRPTVADVVGRVDSELRSWKSILSFSTKENEGGAW